MGAYLNETQEEVTRFGDLDPEDSDYRSIESFLESVSDEEHPSFDWQVLACLAWNLKRDRRKIRLQLEAAGLHFEERPQVKRVRTLHDNPHDRWHGMGASPTHGGSGWEQVTGFAGRAG